MPAVIVAEGGDQAPLISPLPPNDRNRLALGDAETSVGRKRVHTFNWEYLYMLVPNNSAVVIVASTISVERQPMLQTFTFRTQRLIDVADIMQVPIIIGRFPGGTVNTDCLTYAFINSPKVTLPFHPKPETWATTDLGQSIAAASRNQVIIAGFWLEEAVTLLALNCLAVGYDTYVAGDATPAIDAGLEPAARTRLAQAGVVPTSVDQVIREWAALHDDPVQAVKQIADLPQREQNSP